MSKSINLEDIKCWIRPYETSKADDMLKIKKLLEENEKNSRILVLGAKLNPGEVHQAHYHNNETVIVYGLRGNVIATIDGKDVEVRPNTLVYIPPNSIHRFVNNSNQEWECLAFAIGPKHESLGNVWVNHR